MSETREILTRLRIIMVHGDGDTSERLYACQKIIENALDALPTDGTDTGAVAEAAWNSISDDYNKWSALSLDERDTFVSYATAILAHPPPKAQVDAGMVEALREALKPFACDNDIFDAWPDNTRLNVVNGDIIVAHADVGDFRRARSARAALSEDQP